MADDIGNNNDEEEEPLTPEVLLAPDEPTPAGVEFVSIVTDGRAFAGSYGIAWKSVNSSVRIICVSSELKESLDVEILIDGKLEHFIKNLGAGQTKEIMIAGNIAARALEHRVRSPNGDFRAGNAHWTCPRGKSAKVVLQLGAVLATRDSCSARAGT